LTLVSDTSASQVEARFRSLWLHIFRFEQQFSRFLSDSELSRFNRGAGLRQVISPEFREHLLASQRMSKLTDGLYNPFVLPALQRAGYLHSMVARYRDDPVDNYEHRQLTTHHKLLVGDDWAQIPPNTALDLGGSGKGYLGDKLANLARGWRDVSGFWFSLGGDIVAGGFNQVGRPWVVGVEAIDGGLAGQVSAAGSEPFAVATSSTAYRAGRKQGKRWHHIIDPRTQQPAVSDLVSASVTAPSALLSDVLASCLIILGSQTAQTFAKISGARGCLLQTKVSCTASGAIEQLQELSTLTREAA
jgi:thiamine biosynthesis lipoprotein